METLQYFNMFFGTRRERHNFYYADCSYIVLQSTPQLNWPAKSPISANWPNKRAAHPVALSWTALAQVQILTNSNCLWHWVISLFDAHLLLVGVASAPNSTRPGYILISSTGCTCFSIDSWVEGQYVTLRVVNFYSDLFYFIVEILFLLLT